MADKVVVSYKVHPVLAEEIKRFCDDFQMKPGDWFVMAAQAHLLDVYRRVREKVKGTGADNELELLQQYSKYADRVANFEDYEPSQGPASAVFTPMIKEEHDKLLKGE